MSLDLLFVLLLPLSLAAGLLAARWLLTPRCAACHRPLLDPEGAFCSAACLAQGEGIPQPIGQEAAGPVYLPPEALPTLPRGLLGDGDRLTLAPVPASPEEGEEDPGDQPEDDELGTPATARRALPPRLRGWPVGAASLPLFFGGCQRSPTPVAPVQQHATLTHGGPHA